MLYKDTIDYRTKGGLSDQKQSKKIKKILEAINCTNKKPELYEVFTSELKENKFEKCRHQKLKS